jgi:hypothetical protein
MLLVHAIKQFDQSGFGRFPVVGRIATSWWAS